jgi:hypothetical protein
MIRVNQVKKICKYPKNYQKIKYLMIKKKKKLRRVKMRAQMKVTVKNK